MHAQWLAVAFPTRVLSGSLQNTPERVVRPRAILFLGAPLQEPLVDLVATGDDQAVAAVPALVVRDEADVGRMFVDDMSYLLAFLLTF